MRNPSPLRYPGGKVSLTEVLRLILYANRLQGGVYVEPFAGGAGAGLKLLFEGHVDRIIINDQDRAIFSFWNAVMRRTDEFIDRLKSVPLTIDEWHKQREIYRNPVRQNQLDLGFASFYLNRCNRSGIIMNGGPIGGRSQAGKWKLGARFNREDLVRRVREISEYGDRIMVLRENGASLVRRVRELTGNERCFIYADPPYYMKGSELYLNHFTDDDHVELADLIQCHTEVPWVMTYDDVPRIREIYKRSTIQPFRLRYSAHESSLEGGEVLIAPSYVTIPHEAVSTLALKARQQESV